VALVHGGCITVATENLFPHPTNATDPVGFFFTYPNDLTGGLMGIGFLLVLYVIVFGSQLRFGVERAFASASFVGLLAALVLTAMGVVGGQVFTVSVVLVVLAALLAGGSSQ